MVVFLFSANFFTNHYYWQLPHIPINTLKNLPNPEKIKFRAETENGKIQEGITLMDKSQLLGKDGQ